MKLLIIDSHNCRKSINISESATVTQLKEEIKKQNNIKSDILLHFNGVILEDNDHLYDYDIEDNDQIVYTGNFPIKLLIIDPHNCRKLLNIYSSATVTQLKEAIKKQNNIKSDIILHFNGEILEDNDHLYDYDIEDNDQIVYMDKFPAD